jgi:hypothetical protein
MQPTHLPALLSVQDFYRALGGAIGINALRTAVREGRVRSLLVGERKRLIPATELTNWPLRETGEAS